MVVASLLIPLLAVCAAAPAPQSQKELDKAARLLQRQKFEQAELAFADLAEAHPENALVWFQLAVAHSGQKDFANAAEANANAAAIESPYRASALYNLACCRSLTGELEKAEEFGAEILTLCVEVGGVLTGEHGVGVEKRDLMGTMFTDIDLKQQQRVKCAFDPDGLLNPGKMFPRLHRCAELGRVHIHRGQIPFPDLPRF